MSAPVTILLIDDDDEDYLITREALKDVEYQNYKLEWASSYAEGMRVISENRHDVYLVDYRLGGETGLDLIKNAIEQGCKAPLILMTGQGDFEIDEQAMKAGAADYLVKGNLSGFDLDRSIRYSIKEARNVEEIRKLNTELEDRVQKRTVELFKAIKQLEQTNKLQKQAEIEVRKALEKEKELNEMKSRFVTIASHEFRTPLSTILSSTALIKKYNDLGEKEKLDKHIQRIKSSVNNLNGILNDFLSVSKLEEGKTTVQLDRFNLKELMEEIVEEMSPVLKENQEFTFSYSGESEVTQDKHIIKNSIINLVSNAIKYSEKGKIGINSSCNGIGIQIVVSDEGIGIPEQDQQFLFSRFFRAHNAGNIQGTGLGLNIVKRYIELLNGTISFESTPKKGTTFFIELPQLKNENNTTDRG